MPTEPSQQLTGELKSIIQRTAQALADSPDPNPYRAIQASPDGACAAGQAAKGNRHWKADWPYAFAPPRSRSAHAHNLCRHIHPDREHIQHQLQLHTQLQPR